MYKFFVDEIQLEKDNSLIKIKNDYNHIKNVLRLKENTNIEITINNSLKKYLVKIIKYENELVFCSIEKEILDNNESNIYINIVQALPKTDKMEQIIQKCTEIGVKEFTPIALKRCVVKIDKKDEIKKVIRWNMIAEAAAKQAKRDEIPKINEISNINNIVEILKSYDIILVAYEEEKINTFKKELLSIKNLSNIKIAIIIGPEGGIDNEELEKFVSYGYKIVTLGKRILRTETVATIMSAIIMYEFDELN